MKNLKQISFILAAIFIIGALVLKMTRPQWQLYANISIGVGLFFFLVSLWFERSELKNFFTARSTRHGINSVVMIILVLAILGLANWIISRHPLKYDTTKNKQFSLSPLTVSTLKGLKQPVKVTSFFTEAQDDGSRERMRDMLDNFKSYSNQLEVKMVDPLKDPQLTQQFQIETNRTTVFESGKQRTTISTVDEEDITNAILKVVGNKQVKVYFLEGHGEPSFQDQQENGFSAVVDELKKNNYLVDSKKDLAAAPKIPDDCDVLVIAAPKVGLLDPEVDAIKSYLAKGGRVLLMDDPQSDATVQKILDTYHVSGDGDVVVDDHYYYPPAGGAVPLILRKENTPITKEFDYQMFFPLTRSLSYNDKAGTGEVFTPFAESTQFSWGETDKEKAQYDPDKDKKGPLTVGLAISKPLSDKDKKSAEMRLAVFGNVGFAKNTFAGIYGNKKIFLNALAWLTEQENLIHLPPRNTQNDIMMLSSTQLNYIALVLIILIPAVILGTGITVWVKRKKL